jgi:hypothetical protein
MSSMNEYTEGYEALASRNEASRIISTWLKKSIKLKTVYRSIDSEDVRTIEDAVNEVNALGKDSFQCAQEVLSRDVIVQALCRFLNCLPSDPTLKKKNKLARSVRMITSSFLITKFPGLVLEDDGRPDTGDEASQCHTAAKLYVVALRRLLRLLRSPGVSLHQFRTDLVGYRFSLRCFLSGIESWKKIDCDRVKHSFEIAYCETFMVVWSSEKAVANIDEKLETCSESERASLMQERKERERLIESGKTKLPQFREMLGQLLGPRQCRDLLEELDAYLLSSTRSMEEELKQDESLNTQEIVGEVSGSNVVNLSDVSNEPLGESPLPLSPEAAQLKRVSLMTGLGPNKILHELCINSKFALPDLMPELQPFNANTDGYRIESSTSVPSESYILELMQRDPLQGQALLKKTIVRTIEDRFVANMTKSSIQTPSEV